MKNVGRGAEDRPTSGVLCMGCGARSQPGAPGWFAWERPGLVTYWCPHCHVNATEDKEGTR